MISILMPIKNTSQYLKECIDSIIEQTYTEWELIAVDDHSDDDSYDIVHRYSILYSNIYIYKNNGSGIIDALRLALTHSQGKYITRMDSDDIMAPKKLSLLRATLTNRRQVAVGLVKYISNSTLGEGYLNYANWLNKLTTGGINFSEIYKECVIPSPCWMLHKDDLLELGAFNSDIYPEDYDLAFRMRNNGMIVRPVKEIIHIWRDHPDRASRNDPHYMDNNYLNIKLHHFILSDYNRSPKLIIWGAGKKGKKLVKLLIDHQIDIHWICNNPKKIGTKIYNIHLHSPTSLQSISSAQVIIAVAQKNSEVEIEPYLHSVDRSNIFYFC